MSQSSENNRAYDVRRMFARIANHYDRVNHWMTFGQDKKWRRQVLNQAALSVDGRLLDIGAGTGELTLEALSMDKSLLAIAADFTPEMMFMGRERQGGESVRWVITDALDLPFPSGFFDAVVSGYLLRNVVDVEKALSEQYRVLKNGGRVVCLDTTPPPRDLWHLPVRLYLHHIIPLIGQLLTGEAMAYRYLTQSTERFIKVEVLAGYLMKVGFKEVHYRRFIGGAMAIHWGVK